MQKITRRKVLKRSAGVVTAAAGAVTLVKPTYGRLGANDEIQVGVVGFNGQGRSHIRNHQKAPGARVTALCDVDERVWAKGEKTLEGAGGSNPTFYHDIRKLLENKSIDAISIATCNHWHALATIWGCQAGKDVYVEKPISHNLFEAQQMVAAARKYDRVVQVGTQRRSAPHLAEMREIARSGRLGHIGLVRTWIIDHRPVIGHKPDGQPPKGVD